MIKMYPCVLLPNSELYQWWEKGKYKPWSDKKLISTFVKIKSLIPRYVRISRLVRDFPSPSIAQGTKTSNLRQMVQAEMKKQGLKCRCLRCREIGHNPDIDIKKIIPKLFIDKYKSSEGVEYFISFEDTKRRVVFAFLRLRLPSNNDQVLKVLPGLKDCALIRELHTYGHLVPVDQALPGAAQHKGLGKKLMAEAEKICLKNQWKKIAVISGIGVREYYKKIGYCLKDTYMVKSI